MWYKKLDDGSWSVGNKVVIPSNPNAPVVLELNHNAKVQGWEWFDTPPQEYIDYMENLHISIKTETLTTVSNERVVEPLKTKSISTDVKRKTLIERIKEFFVKLDKVIF